MKNPAILLITYLTSLGIPVLGFLSFFSMALVSLLYYRGQLSVNRFRYERIPSESIAINMESSASSTKRRPISDLIETSVPSPSRQLTKEDAKILANSFCRGDMYTWRNECLTSISWRKNVFRFKIDINITNNSLSRKHQRLPSCLRDYLVITVYPIHLFEMLQLNIPANRQIFRENINSFQNFGKRFFVPFDIGVIRDKQRLITVRPWYKHGSLFDLIYNTKPSFSHERKNQIRNTKGKGVPLSENQIRRYFRNILEALLILRKKGIYFSHLHVGNIFVINETALLDATDNIFCSLRSIPVLDMLTMPLEQYIPVDILQFGHVIYECSVGSPLLTTIPKIDMINVAPGIRDLLHFIFGDYSNKSNDEVPTLTSLLDHPFFNASSSATTMNRTPLSSSESSFDSTSGDVHLTMINHIVVDNTSKRNAWLNQCKLKDDGKQRFAKCAPGSDDGTTLLNNDNYNLTRSSAGAYQTSNNSTSIRTSSNNVSTTTSTSSLQKNGLGSSRSYQTRRTSLGFK